MTSDGEKLDSVKAQDHNGSIYICVPKETAADLDIEPGDNVLVRKPEGQRQGVFGRELEAVAND